jgi:hypothetical protein
MLNHNPSTSPMRASVFPDRCTRGSGVPVSQGRTRAARRIWMSRKTEIELPMRHPGVIGVAQTALPDKVATPGYYRSVTPAVCW